MSANVKTIEYIKQGVEALFERGGFRNGSSFRPTQADALSAYRTFLSRDDLTPNQKLSGFFEIPTGVGKTALFLSILDEAHRIARAQNDHLRAMVVVPTHAILNQMEGEVLEWAPDYKDTMGFYSGNKKEMGKELTFITYDSWRMLMETGELNSSHIDILISDEAHRGTSDRSLSNQFNYFSEGTARIAFTATARFDEEKSVEQSHHHEIFSRGVADAVKTGELAAYIQTQFHAIRVAPLQTPDVFNGEAEASQAARTQGAKQEAWIKAMIGIMRDGVDMHTSDPLTDNKSGFFTQGIAMAEHLAELAAQDPELQKRAKAQGCEEVVVAIHSQMPAKERDRRLEDFKRGKYLAVASDEQLKEGFNDPSLKNIFDYPRGSLVDKAQIIGRAARQWFNPQKDRFEGATVIDSIVYIGSEDPSEDQRIKNVALRNAVTAWEILDGTYVLGPTAKPREDRVQKPARTSGVVTTPILGLDITSFVDFEEVQAVYANQRQLQGENKIPLTDEMREDLIRLMSLKGVGSVKLFGAMQNPPEGLSASMIEKLKSPSLVRVEKAHWEAVIAALDSIEDSKARDVIPLTDEMRGELRGLIDRKGFGSVIIFKQIENPPDGLNADVIKSWSVKNSTIKNVVQTHWNAVKMTLETMKDGKRIPLTDAMREDFRREIQKKGVGAKALFNQMENPPDGLSADVIKSWIKINSAIKNVVKIHWEEVKAALEAMEDATAKEVISLTDDMRDELRGLMAKKGVGPTNLFKQIQNPPDGLTTKVIESWVNKNSTTKNINKTHWDPLMKTLNGMPDKSLAKDSKPRDMAGGPS